LNWKKGVKNSSPHSKLKTCFDGKDKLIAAYWAAYNAKSTGENNFCVAIQQAAGLTPEETALNDWLTMIIVKNWFSSVECKLHRYMCKHKTTFSYKRICMMMFILGEVIETKVAQMLMKAKACVMGLPATQPIMLPCMLCSLRERVMPCSKRPPITSFCLEFHL
jgi:hypothetical protein